MKEPTQKLLKFIYEANQGNISFLKKIPMQEVEDNCIELNNASLLSFHNLIRSQEQSKIIEILDFFLSNKKISNLKTKIINISTTIVKSAYIEEDGTYDYLFTYDNTHILWFDLTQRKQKIFKNKEVDFTQICAIHAAILKKDKVLNHILKNSPSNVMDDITRAVFCITGCQESKEMLDICLTTGRRLVSDDYGETFKFIYSHYPDPVDTFRKINFLIENTNESESLKLLPLDLLCKWLANPFCREQYELAHRANLARLEE